MAAARIHIGPQAGLQAALDAACGAATPDLQQYLDILQRIRHAGMNPAEIAVRLA